MARPKLRCQCTLKVQALERDLHAMMPPTQVGNSLSVARCHHIRALATFIAVAGFPLFAFMIASGMAPRQLSVLAASLRALGSIEIVVIAVGAIPIPVALHELGHLAAAMIVGFVPERLVLGPLSISRTRLSMGGWGGAWTASRARPGQRALLLRHWLTIAGGPIVNLLLGTASIYVASTWTNVAPGVQWFLVMVGIMAGLHLVGVMIPGTVNGITTDGLTLLVILRGGRAAQRLEANLRLAGENAAGIEPTEWDHKSIEIIRAFRCPTAEGASGRLLLVVPWLIAHGSWDEAWTELRHIDRMSGVLVQSHMPMLLALKAIVMVHRKDLLTARELLSKLPPRCMVPEQLVACVEAALEPSRSAAELNAKATGSWSPNTGTGVLWARLLHEHEHEHAG